MCRERIDLFSLTVKSFKEFKNKYDLNNLKTIKSQLITRDS